MPTSHTAIERWIAKSEIDYLTYFIKTWIPFNAWYAKNYPAENGDRAKIQALKNNTGDNFRKAITGYLKDAAGQDGVRFRSFLGQLHRELEKVGFTYSPKNGEKDTLSFSTAIREQNPDKCRTLSYNGIDYYANRLDTEAYGQVEEIKLTVKNRSGETTFCYTHSDYEEVHFQSGLVAKSIPPPQRERLEQFFREIIPIRIQTALQQTLDKSPKNYVECNGINFALDTSATNDQERVVAKALIEILYQLRNILFHGELDPTEDVQPVYENAYQIMRMLVSKLT